MNRIGNRISTPLWQTLVTLSVIVTFAGILSGCDSFFGSGSDKTPPVTTYAVTYLGNGNTGGSEPQDAHGYQEGEAVTVSGNTGGLLKSGYDHLGWNTASDGSGTHHIEGATFTMPAGDVTLYAEWIKYRDMVLVPGGTFEQTYVDENGNSDGGYTHTISTFEMAKYTVTYDLWYGVRQWAQANGYTIEGVGQEGSHGSPGAVPTDGARYLPVTAISWRDAIVWLNAYSETAGLTPVYYTNAEHSTPIKNYTAADALQDTAGSIDKPYVNWEADGYRLPTEGEWQYAAGYIDGSDRTNPAFASGATAGIEDEAATGAVAWYGTGEIRKVGTKAPNQLGIHDMSGNVTEWCWDWSWSADADPKTDFRGPANPTDAEDPRRMVRGGSIGSHGDYLHYLRIGNRDSEPPWQRPNDFGLRPVRVP